MIKKTRNKLLMLSCFILLTGCTPAKNAPSPSVATTAAPTVIPSVSPAAPPSAVPIALQTEAKASARLAKLSEEKYGNGQYQEAVTTANKAIVLDATNANAYAIKGIALSFLGNTADGIQSLKQAVDLKPDLVSANYFLAFSYKLQKNYDHSLIWFENTIKLDPENIWSYYGISTIYADRNQVDKSLAYLKKAIDLSPDVKKTARTQDHFAKMRSNPEFQAMTK
ncbi:MAG: hypothetical protein H7Y41_00375 [Hyphomonadaceae bacterium]|nr:hypothetical protein [Clostridia bacterium]